MAVPPAGAAEAASAADPSAEAAEAALAVVPPAGAAEAALAADREAAASGVDPGAAASADAGKQRKNQDSQRATPHKGNNKIPFRASNNKERVQKYPLLIIKFTYNCQKRPLPIAVWRGV